jgi:hypothetical protein
MSKKEKKSKKFVPTFKDGDKVLLKSDLSSSHRVVKSWTSNRDTGMFWCYPTFTDCESVALDNDKVYNISELVEYSEPIEILAQQIKELTETKKPVKNHKRFSNIFHTHDLLTTISKKWNKQADELVIEDEDYDD